MKFVELINELRDDLSKGRLNLIFFIGYFFTNPSFRVILNYRLGRYFRSKKGWLANLIVRRFRYIMVTKRGCDISYNAFIGRGLKLPHPIGIVIGDGVRIGDNVTLYQQVTLGSHGKSSLEKQYPIIKSGARIYAGAIIIGGVEIGENAKIAANSFVNINVPKGKTAIGMPCKILEN